MKTVIPVSNPPSMSARLLTAAMGAARIKRRQFDPDRFVGPKAKRRVAHAYRPPRSTARGVEIRSETVENWPVVTLVADPEAGSDPILFLHGGAYAAEIMSGHWKFAATLAQRTRRPVTVPVYPLTPEHDHTAVFPTLTRIYAQLAMSGPVAVVGDSAGAGMSLALSELIADSDDVMPEQLVLLSPFVDAEISDPASADIEPSDPLLTAAHLRQLARYYAGDAEVSDPRISPINGRLTDLPPMLIFTGTRDLLNPDARRLADMVDSAGGQVALHEYPGMIHDWILMPMPEAHDAIDRISLLLAHPDTDEPNRSNGARAS